MWMSNGRWHSMPVPEHTKPSNEKRCALCAPWSRKNELLSAASADDLCLHRLHQLFRIGEICLRYPDLLLEILHHVFPQPHFCRFLGDGHLVDLVLQPQ